MYLAVLRYSLGPGALLHDGTCQFVWLPLGHYNVDKDQISVSGLSSGAYFAVQFHVSFSKTIMGAGIVAGGSFVRSISFP